METITIDNKHYIEGKIVMLPTINKQTSDIILREDNKYLEYCEFCSINFKESKYFTPQHLYLVCDLPIEEDDYYIDDVAEIRQSVTSDKEYWNRRTNYRKVIATTDDKLHKNQYTKEELGNHTPINYGIPKFPQSFIKEFVERQGKDVDVLVEIDYKESYCNACVKDCIENGCKPINIKLNPDNTVNLIFK